MKGQSSEVSTAGDANAGGTGLPGTVKADLRGRDAYFVAEPLFWVCPLGASLHSFIPKVSCWKTLQRAWQGRKVTTMRMIRMTQVEPSELWRPAPEGKQQY